MLGIRSYSWPGGVYNKLLFTFPLLTTKLFPPPGQHLPVALGRQNRYELKAFVQLHSLLLALPG